MKRYLQMSVIWIVKIKKIFTFIFEHHNTNYVFFYLNRSLWRVTYRKKKSQYLRRWCEHY